MVGPGGLEPLTSSVSTYHRQEENNLDRIERLLYNPYTSLTGKNHR